ncbi:cytochrome P450 [Aureobasidium sp. EXF-3400]|nr:cytochrome P450 [Aureobasidium sp. EXF-12344]KAI4771293.1 cytochrome P450 [Aureobasidium sp. EXF-3400]
MPTVLGEALSVITGGGDMLTSDGPQWKIWRSAFNPGFSVAHLMTMMPTIVDNVATFAQILQKHAVNNELFRMEHHATRLTIDIIGKVVLDDDFNSQLTEHPLVTAFESQVRWMKIIISPLISLAGTQRPLQVFNIFRPFVQWWNLRQMDTYVGNILEERFASRNTRGKKKHVIDLALETYLKENNVDDVSKLDPKFKDAALRNIKIFIFAGHDTSSSSICYCHYQLSQHPTALARLRKECEEIFGKDMSKTGDMIKADPYLLNKMRYGDAVVRETLRIFPPANTVRIGAEDFFITNPETGERYPTDGWLLWAHNLGHMVNPKIWGEDVYSFRPERWLVDETQTKNPADREAFMAFAKGPRNCIGQELAMLELKMVLAMTIRQFDFKEAFTEVEKLKNDGSGYPSDLSGVQEQFGQKAYQIQLGTAKPREGMPCRLSLVDT